MSAASMASASIFAIPVTLSEPESRPAILVRFICSKRPAILSFMFCWRSSAAFMASVSIFAISLAPSVPAFPNFVTMVSIEVTAVCNAEIVCP